MRQKAEENLEAIRLLKQIEQQRRPATEAEKSVLVRYCGWGALPQLFHPCPGEWSQLANTLKQALTATEYASAQASTPNAHYTSTAVIHAIWRALLDFGLAAPLQILEPAAGIGHFFGGMPASLYPNAVRLGVELDSVSARMAQLLYPDSTVREAGFESVSLPDSFFDVAIGNVPFG